MGALRLYPGDINQVVVTENINYVARSNHPECFYCETRFKR
jgi:hypothetical protein